jgi:acyl-CoA reductase-like NAD-dependent aldehyde dehydrogenase
MNPLLLLVDLQRDYLDAPGIEPDPATVVDHAARLLRHCRQSGTPVAHVWTTVRRDPDNRMPHWKLTDRWRCEEGTPGHAAPASLTPRSDEEVFHKSAFSGFESPQLRAFLRQRTIDTLIVAGVKTHACVRQTAIDAWQAGLAVWIASDAVGSDDPVHAAITRRYLEERGVRFAPAAELLASLDTTQAASLRNGEAHTALRASVSRAQSAAASWRATPISQRVAGVRRFTAALAERSHQLATLMAEELGKPVRFGRLEVQRTVQMLEAIATRVEAAASRGASRGDGFLVRRRPHGALAVITPWNNPLYIPLGKVVPAILCGNSVVWKPAPQARATSRHVFDMFSETQWPPGLISMLEGGTHDAQALMCDAAIAAVTITGSSAAGYSAQEICARRRIPLQAELGGNNAAIVWRDADLLLAARLIAGGAFEMAGQRCTANRRVIVHAAVRDVFLWHLERETALLAWGDPHDEQTRIGPMVNATERDRIAATVERAVAIGAPTRLPLGASPSCAGSHRTAWYPPTIVTCDDPSCEIVQEETFGPLLVVQTARDRAHAMTLCNGVRQGLVASMFSTSREMIEQFLDEAQAGILKVNQSTADAAVDAPFGGWKASGIGPPEHGTFDLDFHCRPQTVYD